MSSSITSHDHPPPRALGLEEEIEWGSDEDLLPDASELTSSPPSRSSKRSAPSVQRASSPHRNRHPEAPFPSTRHTLASAIRHPASLVSTVEMPRERSTTENTGHLIMQKDRSFLSVREKGKKKEEKKEKRALGGSSLVDMDNLSEVQVPKQKEAKKGLFGMFKGGKKKANPTEIASTAGSSAGKSTPSLGSGLRYAPPPAITAVPTLLSQVPSRPHTPDQLQPSLSQIQPLPHISPLAVPGIDAATIAAVPSGTDETTSSSLDSSNGPQPSIFSFKGAINDATIGVGPRQTGPIPSNRSMPFGALTPFTPSSGTTATRWTPMTSSSWTPTTSSLTATASTSTPRMSPNAPISSFVAPLTSFISSPIAPPPRPSIAARASSSPLPPTIEPPPSASVATTPASQTFSTLSATQSVASVFSPSQSQTITTPMSQTHSLPGSTHSSRSQTGSSTYPLVNSSSGKGKSIELSTSPAVSPRSSPENETVDLPFVRHYLYAHEDNPPRPSSQSLLRSSSSTSSSESKDLWDHYGLSETFFPRFPALLGDIFITSKRSDDVLKKVLPEPSLSNRPLSMRPSTSSSFLFARSTTWIPQILVLTSFILPAAPPESLSQCIPDETLTEDYKTVAHLHLFSDPFKSAKRPSTSGLGSTFRRSSANSANMPWTEPKDRLELDRMAVTSATSAGMVDGAENDGKDFVFKITFGEEGRALGGAVEWVFQVDDREGLIEWIRAVKGLSDQIRAERNGVARAYRQLLTTRGMGEDTSVMLDSLILDLAKTRPPRRTRSLDLTPESFRARRLVAGFPYGSTATRAPRKDSGSLSGPPAAENLEEWLAAEENWRKIQLAEDERDAMTNTKGLRAKRRSHSVPSRRSPAVSPDPGSGKAEHAPSAIRQALSLVGFTSRSAIDLRTGTIEPPRIRVREPTGPTVVVGGQGQRVSATSNSSSDLDDPFAKAPIMLVPRVSRRSSRAASHGSPVAKAGRRPSGTAETQKLARGQSRTPSPSARGAGRPASSAPSRTSSPSGQEAGWLSAHQSRTPSPSILEGGLASGSSNYSVRSAASSLSLNEHQDRVLDPANPPKSSLASHPGTKDQQTRPSRHAATQSEENVMRAEPPSRAIPINLSAISSVAPSRAPAEAPLIENPRFSPAVRTAPSMPHLQAQYGLSRGHIRSNSARPPISPPPNMPLPQVPTHSPPISLPKMSLIQGRNGPPPLPPPDQPLPPAPNGPPASAPPTTALPQAPTTFALKPLHLRPSTSADLARNSGVRKEAGYDRMGPSHPVLPNQQSSPTASSVTQPVLSRSTALHIVPAAPAAVLPALGQPLRPEIETLNTVQPEITKSEESDTLVRSVIQPATSDEALHPSMIGTERHSGGTPTPPRPKAMFIPDYQQTVLAAVSTGLAPDPRSTLTRTASPNLRARPSTGLALSSSTSSSISSHSAISARNRPLVPFQLGPGRAHPLFTRPIMQETAVASAAPEGSKGSSVEEFHTPMGERPFTFESAGSHAEVGPAVPVARRSSEALVDLKSLNSTSTPYGDHRPAPTGESMSFRAPLVNQSSVNMDPTTMSGSHLPQHGANVPAPLANIAHPLPPSRTGSSLSLASSVDQTGRPVEERITGRSREPSGSASMKSTRRLKSRAAAIDLGVEMNENPDTSYIPPVEEPLPERKGSSAVRFS